MNHRSTEDAPPALDEVVEAGGLRVAWQGPDGQPVVTVTLDRPEVRNAQMPATWRALAAVGAALPAATRAVVLRASGPTFSAGLDRRMFLPDGVDGEGLALLAALDDAALDARVAEYQRGFTWWADLDVPTVAVVQGAAVGAGFQLALACDLRVCADDARFAMRETVLGLVPDLTGTSPLVRQVGYARALEICVTGRWVDAAEAAGLGLATQVVPLGEQDAAAAALVDQVLAAPDASVRATRRLLRGVPGRSVAEQRAAERREQAALLRALAGS